MTIEIFEDYLVIDKANFSYPLDLNKLKSLLNSEPRITEFPDERKIFTFDDSGIYCHTDNGINAKAFNIGISNGRFKFSPESDFSGEVIYNGKNALENKPKEEDKIGSLELYNDITDDKKSYAFISFNMPEGKIETSSKSYENYPEVKDPIEFTDINFKLAVMDILMYDEGVLEPQFDIYDFAKEYSERKIDVEENGYNIIPEALNYFKNYPIDKSHAGLITEIFQDGGNEIYMNICPFWDGEDDIFNIKSAEDAVQFPNLKKVTLFYENEGKVIEGFKKLGIDSEYL